jgi:hypothetical protein
MVHPTGMAVGILIFLLILAPMAFTLLGLFWANQRGILELPEFTKYKVFNDCPPNEPQPSPWRRWDLDPPRTWSTWLLLALMGWMLWIVGAMMAGAA